MSEAHSFVQKLFTKLNLPVAGLLLCMLVTTAVFWHYNKNTTQNSEGNDSTIDLTHQQLAIRNHQDGKLIQSGQSSLPHNHLIPWLIGSAQSLELCVDTPTEIDTSRWQATITFHELAPENTPDSSAAFAHSKSLSTPIQPVVSTTGSRLPNTSVLSDNSNSAPITRMGTVLCFAQRLPRLQVSSYILACIQLSGSNKPINASCLPFYFEPSNSTYEQLVTREKQIVQSQSIDNQAELLLQLARDAEQLQFPLLSMRAQLTAVYFLNRKGTPQHQESVRRILGTTPTWFDTSAANVSAAQISYQRSVLDLSTGELRNAWKHIKEAQQRYRRVAHPQSIAALTRRAEILMKAGAATEAQNRLILGIDECAETECEPTLLRNAKNTLGWWLLQKPNTTSVDLGRAKILFDASIIDTHGLERANILINQAYAEVLKHQNPTNLIAEAQALIDSDRGNRAKHLSHWGQLISSLWKIEQGDLDSSKKALDLLIKQSTQDSLRAHALVVRAKLYRKEKNLIAAQIDLEQAALVHRYLSQFDQTISPNPGQHADIYYELARLAIEQNNLPSSWSWLEKLDRLVPHENCDAAVEGTATLSQSAQIKAKQAQLLSQISQLDAPASTIRKQQRNRIRAHLQEELQELIRSQCKQKAHHAEANAHYQAFALSDEIIVLFQDDQGVITLEKRSKFKRLHLQQRLDELTEMMKTPNLQATEHQQLWIMASREVANALLPRESMALNIETYFVLYGLLQQTPLNALPFRDGWFSDYSTAVLQPLVIRPHHTKNAQTTDQRLFVIDPEENLPSSARSESLYKVLFSDAEILSKENASINQVINAAQNNQWIHFDSHAQFEPGFPELSHLIMSDGVLNAQNLQDHMTEVILVNLSGCQTGKWPITASRGEYGLAGQFVELGAAWAIATRTDLTDQLALDFNTAFYHQIALQAHVSTAFSRALTSLKQHYSVTEWSAILLLGQSQGAKNEFADSPINKAVYSEKRH